MSLQTGYCERSVQRALRLLESYKIIKHLGSNRGGRGKSTEYEIYVENWPKSGRKRVTSTTEKGDIHDMKRVTSTTEKGDMVSPDPLGTVIESPIETGSLRKIAQAIPLPPQLSDKQINAERNRQRQAFEAKFGIRL